MEGGTREGGRQWRREQNTGWSSVLTLLLPCCVAWAALLPPRLSLPFCARGAADCLSLQALRSGGRAVGQEATRVWGGREVPWGRRTPCLDRSPGEMPQLLPPTLLLLARRRRVA